ncbi:SGNH/GDSL hydrolase family protein [Chitinophaga rhizosphaerae]|uniref:SGNH/GDSL hydrolase family protein n=1 Tax=Chitinophaga rhizosphaerae TaxID=1864947 RepID=UPI00196B3B25|nr:SGNH/GDSL hydrolase family protein [Chitinophaga rhizosphaerae]
MSTPIKNWLALGDSYTIGEGVPLFESFPYQALRLLRAAGMLLQAPEIVAKTGWTTGELVHHLQHHTRLLPEYDFVSLLIGVNNQYRGLPETEFAQEFEWLAKRAQELAGGGKVVVVSIPDWSVTPFAAGRDTDAICNQIDEFNGISREISGKLGIPYINITESYRLTGGRPESVAEDKLHPSGAVYAEWAEKVAAAFGDG